MGTTMDIAANFIELDAANVLYLLAVGFIGGLVSGFIGSGGAFVLTPAMMSMGVPGIIAVASNICHKFPKSLVGSIKRAKYGQVDVKLGLVIGVSAEAGVLYGAQVQQDIKEAFGDAGSNLYVSVAFVIVLAVVGSIVLLDALRMQRSGGSGEEKVPRLARWVQAIHIPGTMVYFKSLNARVSVLFTIPLGFATGMLAATIAVGGFVGVPGMHYLLGAPSLMASATELVVAFVMGLGGTLKYAWSGLVDIRLAMIILAGSLFGVQLGAIGTTYVKPHMIKLVMGTIMMLVLVSRGLVIPVYLADLELIDKLDPSLVSILKNVSFGILVTALAIGAFIIFGALLKGMAAHRRELAAAPALAAAPVPTAVVAPAVAPSTELIPFEKFERFLVSSDGSEYSEGAIREALRMAERCGARLRVVSVVAGGNAELYAMGEQLLQRELDAARAHLDGVAKRATEHGVACETEVVQASEIDREIVRQASRMNADLIIMGRRGRRGLARLMLGDVTAQVIGYAPCNVLVVPRIAELSGHRFVVASDGSEFGDAAAVVAGRLAKLCSTPVTVLSVVLPSHSQQRRDEARATVERLTGLLQAEELDVDGKLLDGRPDAIIADTAIQGEADLIVLGSHGRTGIERVLLGSTTERVLNATSAAVLVVRAA